MVRPERLLGAYGPSSSASLRTAAAPCAAASNPAQTPGCRTRFFVCREFELQRGSVGADEGFSGKESGGAPGEIASGPMPLVLRFAPDRRRALRGSVQPGADAGLSNRFRCLSGVRITSRIHGADEVLGHGNLVRPDGFELPTTWFEVTFALLLRAPPDYAGVRRFNGLFVGFLFLAQIIEGRYDRSRSLPGHSTD